MVSHVDCGPAHTPTIRIGDLRHPELKSLRAGGAGVLGASLSDPQDDQRPEPHLRFCHGKTCRSVWDENSKVDQSEQFFGGLRDVS